MIHHHQDVQKSKGRNGKQAWIRRSEDDRWYADVLGRAEQVDVETNAFVHQYRIRPSCRSSKPWVMSQAKALEWWRPPTGAGQALGCLTTTFGVDMDLLHKHALGGFLDIEADPEDEEFMYLAAFEEAAAQCEALVVFLDGGHVQASIPSWRLDVVPVRRCPSRESHPPGLVESRAHRRWVTQHDQRRVPPQP